jgi:hypothetical protein
VDQLHALPHVLHTLWILVSIADGLARRRQPDSSLVKVQRFASSEEHDVETHRYLGAPTNAK